MKMRMKMAMTTGIMTKKRTKLPKQYVLTGDEVQALVDFAREVIGLAVEDDDGKEPGYLLVAGQLDTDTIKRFDAIIRHHGFEELIQDGELDDDLCNHRDEDSVYCDCHCGCQCGVCRRQRETAPVDSPSGNGPTPEPDETAGKLDHVPIRRQPVDD